MNNNFLAMEKNIHDFAQELYFRNEAATDLVEKDEQKDLLHFDRSDVEELQEIAGILKDFCQPQVRAILEVSEEAKKTDLDQKLLQNQSHQLLQNFSNLEKLVAYAKKQAEQKNKKLSKQWVELKENLAKMNVNQIEDIEKTTKSMS
ncbi:hypothetical protein GTO82_06270 [Lactobacillus johnsonii]|uniref:Uncharacterized protein n=1 Tax=Lactobacillus johnsonii TaxID=33959 RepID=A0A9X7TYE4_LACJH|nr:hypothetical protein [Lactobacillus johnsonii]QLL68464.1 hypothetical protein GTO82_06270 [Lactobacillus johnsonii]